MSTTCNDLAGTSVDRLAAISGGIFGVAMTLLLDLNMPEKWIVAASPKIFSPRRGAKKSNKSVNHGLRGCARMERKKLILLIRVHPGPSVVKSSSVSSRPSRSSR
ncbi:MAG TPA: hypothetical protein VHY37_07575 [Tepidisphaeraceae bacterium]|jgi:hypothetical protein|nr:hypothetical protein [Tepidisphaeraceae bacterium]